nr:MAG TPA: ASCH domain protein [Caudoviricetes sp.]
MLKPTKSMLLISAKWYRERLDGVRKTIEIRRI